MKILRRIASCALVFGVFSIFGVSNSYGKTIGISSQDGIGVLNSFSNEEEIVSTLNKKDKVEIIGLEGDYYFVSLDNKIEGYVKKDSLHIDSISGISTGDRVNIRVKPNTSCQVLGQVNKGDDLVITGKLGDWYQVVYNDSEAWIYEEYVRTAEEAFLPQVKVEVQVSSNKSANEIIAYAKRFIGTPYRYAGTDLSRGVDCSGFTQSVMGNFGISLNRTSGGQGLDGYAVSKKDLQPGDLVLFDTSGVNNGNISHVGIYIGDNQFIHSESSRGVIISSLGEGYYTRTYVKAVRVL
ncbi:MAG: SH3 domain-containing protein [Epulopiscium sp.]|nr:SH3 domain-containing protein [Candidatus Epulonipiscium sp.]